MVLSNCEWTRSRSLLQGEFSNQADTASTLCPTIWLNTFILGSEVFLSASTERQFTTTFEVLPALSGPVLRLKWPIMVTVIVIVNSYSATSNETHQRRSRPNTTKPRSNKIDKLLQERNKKVLRSSCCRRMGRPQPIKYFSVGP